MTAFNVVGVMVKPEYEEDLVEFHRKLKEWKDRFPGMRRYSLINTGERTYCLVGEWDCMDDIVAARPAMIEVLDEIRHMLEVLDDELGVSDPVSGEAIVEELLYEPDVYKAAVEQIIQTGEEASAEEKTEEN